MKTVTAFVIACLCLVAACGRQPDLSKVIWPPFPSRVNVAELTAAEKSRIEAAHRLANQAIPRIQPLLPTVKYRLFKGMWVGTLPGWDDIDNVTVWIGQTHLKIFFLTMHYKDGRSVSIQYDPIQIMEYTKQNTLSLWVRLDQSGNLLLHDAR
ncbi:hypothetical protein LLG95_10780 [bacterium]|nr:hypothetical protein [bacterium]